jgi:hypothetical protein
MNGKKIIAFSLMGALLVTLLVFINVEAAKPKHTLTIVNKAGGGDRWFVIKDDYQLDFPPPNLDLPDEQDALVDKFVLQNGESAKIELKEDTYWIFYEACGEFWDNPIKLENDYKLIVYPCANRPTKMRINNHFDETITINFDGYDEYEFDVEFGKNKVELFSGNYDYTYEACGEEKFGEMKVDKAGTSELTLHSCEWYEHPARIHGPLNPVKYKIINHASFPVIMTLIGPENYLVTADPGVNILQLVAGSYKFSYYLDYQTHTGSMFVPKHGNGSLIMRPAYVMDNGLSEAE